MSTKHIIVAQHSPESSFFLSNLQFSNIQLIVLIYYIYKCPLYTLEILLCKIPTNIYIGSYPSDMLILRYIRISCLLYFILSYKYLYEFEDIFMNLIFFSVCIYTVYIRTLDTFYTPPTHQNFDERIPNKKKSLFFYFHEG